MSIGGSAVNDPPANFRGACCGVCPNVTCAAGKGLTDCAGEVTGSPF